MSKDDFRRDPENKTKPVTQSAQPDIQHYLNAADSIPTGGLSHLAASVISDTDMARFFSKQSDFRENTILLGIASENISGYQPRGAAAFDKHNRDMAKRTAEGRRVESFDTLAYVALINDLNAQAQWFGARAAERERAFEDKYGEDWREQMAQRILDPDDIPQRRDGESMDDYRDRLEETLIDELLDEEGNIKPDYADDPEVRKWGEWAQDVFQTRAALRDRDYINEPGISAEERMRREKEVSESNSFMKRSEISDHIDDPDKRAEIDATYQAERDAKTVEVAASTADNAFLNG